VDRRTGSSIGPTGTPATELTGHAPSGIISAGG